MAFYHTPEALSAPVGLLLATPGQQPEEGAGTSQKTGRTNQEEQCCVKAAGAGMEPQEVEAEVGRHWADEEVRALLQTWAERRAELQGAARNKSIFQEMALRLQRLGVERSWKQCRTKYKNLKYDYKSARHSPHRTMKFYSEVEAIMQGRDLSHTWRGQPMSSCLDEQNISPDRSEDGCGKARVVQTAGGTISVGRARAVGGAGADTVNMANSVGVADTVGVVDAGRNWQEEEVRALLSVWAEPAVRRQLENATRNRDIFLRVSERLRHLGVERDWRQCRTKYKNLKYVYRSLQRAHSAPGHTPASCFYKELDAILRKAPPKPQLRVELEKCSTLVTCPVPAAYSHAAASLTTHPSQAGLAPVPRAGSGTADADSVETSEHKGVKREASDEEYNMPSKRPAPMLETEDQNLNSSVQDITTIQCKEEPDQCAPIIEIKSVCSVDPPDAIAHKLVHRFPAEMASTSELKVGKKLNEGKTKEIYDLPEQPGKVLVQSKDQITAGNAVRKDQMEGKAVIANKTTSCVFRLLQQAGLKTAFVKQHSDTAFVAAHCEMIPIEWVCRRVATGSFLKRNPGVKEGYRFSPLKIEMFFKDDANNDPQWSEEQLLEAHFCPSGLEIGRCEVDIMSHSTVAIFEILERAWATQNCTLVDMKIEFGVDVVTKEVVLADVIDNDSWRLWPSGDRSQQKDKQVYRDLKEVTPEAMQMVKRNFEWVSERVEMLLEPQAQGRVVVLMGSASDLAHCERIRTACSSYGLHCTLRVTSAHKGPAETLRIKAEYEGDGVPTVFVAVAGRSNGLGPVVAGNTVYPVINCPPISPDWGTQDVWSSLRMPSGLGCSTVLSPDAAAQFAAQVLGLSDHLVWARLRASMLNTWVSLKQADKKLQGCSL